MASKRFVGICAVVAIGLLGSLFLARDASAIFEAITRFASSLGLAGAVLLLAIQVLVCVVGVLPASLVGIACGALYGFAGGSAVAVTGTTIGAIGGYYLGCFGGAKAFASGQRRWVSIEKIKGFLSTEGWKSIFLIRLSPILPFSATSIALGAAGTSLGQYLAGTTASLPALLAYVYLGSALSVGSRLNSLGGSALTPIFIALGVVAAVALAGRYVAYAKSQQ